MEIAEWQRDGISEMMIPQTAQLDAGPGSRPGASGGPVTLPSAPLFRHGQKGLGQKVHSSTPKVPSCGRRLAFIKNRLRHATPASRRVKSSNFSHSGNNATPQSRDQWHKKTLDLFPVLHRRFGCESNGLFPSARHIGPLRIVSLRNPSIEMGRYRQRLT